MVSQGAYGLAEPAPGETLLAVRRGRPQEQDMTKIALFRFPTFSEFEIMVAASILNRRYPIETLDQTTHLWH